MVSPEIRKWLRDVRGPYGRGVIKAIEDGTVTAKEVRRDGGVSVQLTFTPTGTTVTHRCGASRSQSYADAFDLLLDKLGADGQAASESSE